MYVIPVADSIDKMRLCGIDLAEHNASTLNDVQMVLVRQGGPKIC
jgi:hypothetical protein